MAFWLSCLRHTYAFASTIRAFRDCSSLGRLTAPLGQRPANRRRQSLPASRNKRSVVRAPCTCLHVTASCLFTPLCCSCLHTVAYVLVAWCKTSHEPFKPRMLSRNVYVHGFRVGYPLHAPRAMMKPFFSLKGKTAAGIPDQRQSGEDWDSGRGPASQGHPGTGPDRIWR